MRSSRNRLRYEESRKLGSHPCQGKNTFSSPRLPDCLTRTEALSPAVQRPKRGTDHSALSTVKVINKWSYVSTPPSFLTLRRLMSYIYIYIYIYIYMEHPFLMFLDHTQRRSTVGRTPLDE